MSTMTLGKMISELETIHAENPTLLVYFQNNDKTINEGSDRYYSVGQIYSWRGNYRHLCITPLQDGTTEYLERLLISAKGCVGTKLSGYKGGLYEMNLDTPVWCGYHGEHDLVAEAITHIEHDVNENKVVINTKTVDVFSHL